MAAVSLYQCLQALPSREAEQALLAFRASAEAWDVCLGIVGGSHGAIPDQLALFAAQTLHACARRFPLPKDGDAATIDETTAIALINRQQALLSALVHLSGQEGRNSILLCAALAALSVRNAATVRDLLSAALQQLSQWLAVQLLLAMAEECEALQASAGSVVGRCAASLHVLREEVGHHVLAWLAGITTTHLESPPLLQHQHQQHQHQQHQHQHQHQQHQQPEDQYHHLHRQSQPQGQHGMMMKQPAVQLPDGDAVAGPGQQPPPTQQQQSRLLSLTVRCVGAWSRLGCLHAACCPVGAVRELVTLMMRCVHPGSGGNGGLAVAVSAALRHETCEALGDVIEHGPDALLREMNNPLVQLAAAAATAAANAPRSSRRHVSGGDDAEAVYDIVQLVSSYAAARLGELVTAACGSGGVQEPLGAEVAAEAEALVAALCQLAALPGWTEGGYPVSWLAMQVLADLALGCIAAAGPQALADAAGGAAVTGPTAAVTVRGGGEGGGAEELAGDAMQHDGGGGDGAKEAAGTSVAAPPSEESSTAREHCVPDITLGPRPGLPAPLHIMYDNVLRSVLSCCVAWSLLDAKHADVDSPLPATIAPLSSAAAVAVVVDGGGGGDDSLGLLRLPPECEEALRGCLQACAGVVGQSRQLNTALALMQHATEQQAAAATAAAVVVDGWPTAAATWVASLTAALAAVSACGTLPPAQPCGGDVTAVVVATATAASWILLTAADHLRGRGGAIGANSGAARLAPPQLQPAAAAAPAGLAAPLTLHYCEALTGSCGVVLQQQLAGGQGRVEGRLAMGQAGAGASAGSSGSDSSAAWVLCRLAEPALAGLQLEASAVAAARALRALMAAAHGVALPLPVQLVEALAEAWRALPYDAGPSYQAAEREVVRAVVAAAAVYAEGHAARLDLLSQAVSSISQTTAAAIAAVAATASAAAPPTAPPPPGALPQPSSSSSGTLASPRTIILSRHQDAVLTRQLRLLEAALTSALASPSGADAPPPPEAPAATAVTGWSAATTMAVFVQQVWPALRTLLQRGAAGRFLMPMCRCLALLLRRCGGGGTTTAAACGWIEVGCSSGDGDGGGGGGNGVESAAMQVQWGGSEDPGGGAAADPWVASVLEALAACVGRPGAKHVYEPLAALLEACTAPFESRLQQPEASSTGVGGLQQSQQQQQQQCWRQRHAVLVARTVHDILDGRIATELAASWRAADRDPDSAECLLRLATTAVRYGGLAALTAYGAGGIVGDGRVQVHQDFDGMVTPAASAAPADSAVQGSSTTACATAAVAAAALRLAAASSGCDHRQVAAAALACTCAVLEATRGPRASVTGGVGTAPILLVSLAPDGAGGGGGGGAVEHRELMAVVIQSGPVVASGLLAALLSSSPLPRLQRVATALVLLGAAVATCYDLETHQQRHSSLTTSSCLGAVGSPAAALQACAGVLGSWLVAAAAALQLSAQEGAELASSWAPLLAEAGLGAAAVAAASASAGGVSTAARALSRKLRRVLREFAERRLRA